MQWICLKTDEKKRDSNINNSLPKFIFSLTSQMIPKVKFLFNLK